MKPLLDTPITRRDLLRRAGAAATTLCLAGPMRLARAATPWPMQLSTSTVQFSTLPIEQACERISQLGFDAVDLWSAYDHCPHLDDALDRLGPAGLQDLLARHKLRLYAFSVYVGGYPKYAALLGGAGGGVAVRGSGPPCKPEELSGAMRQFLEDLKPELELAEKHNSYLAIENHGHSLLDSLDAFKAFVELNAHPRLGIALAPYHLQAIGASVEEAVAIAGKQLFFFYAWQNAPDTGQLPGEGPTDFTPWLAALARVEFRWPVNPFMHGHPEPDVMAGALARSRAYLLEKHRVL